MIRSGKVSSYPWERYSKKLAAAIASPKHVGYFTPKEAQERSLRLAVGREGKREEGNSVALFWLVDPSDGVIVDALFQVYGQSALTGAAEIACQLLIRKNYEQARRLSADLIDKQVQDRAMEMAFPEEAFGHLNLVLFAIDDAASQCMTIPIAEESILSPFGESDTASGPYPGWESLSTEQKRAMIEQVIDQEIRPYIELDDGGLSIVAFNQDKEVVISYKGSCTSCYASTGSTLSAIQGILQSRLHSTLHVTVDLPTL